MQFLQRGTQVFIVLRLNGIDARKDHGLGFLEALDGLVTRPCYVGDGVTHLYLAAGLDTRYDITHIAGSDAVGRFHLQFQHAYLVGVVFLAGLHKTHAVTRPHRAVYHLEVRDDTAEGVEHRVEDQALQGCILVAHGSRNTLYDGIQYGLYALTRLGGAA